jgi:small subunit ribosomal protein S6
MPLYEIITIVRQEVSSAAVETLTEHFSTLLAQGGGSVKKLEQWGLRPLTYRIKKNRKGHYIFMGVEAPPAAVIELERNLRINEDVLRYLTIRTDALEEGPSAILVNRDRPERSERPDRPERGGMERGAGNRRPGFGRRFERDSDIGDELNDLGGDEEI